MLTSNVAKDANEKQVAAQQAAIAAQQAADLAARKAMHNAVIYISQAATTLQKLLKSATNSSQNAEVIAKLQYREEKTKAAVEAANNAASETAKILQKLLQSANNIKDDAANAENAAKQQRLADEGKAASKAANDAVEKVATAFEKILKSLSTTAENAKKTADKEVEAIHNAQVAAAELALEQAKNAATEARLAANNAISTAAKTLQNLLKSATDAADNEAYNNNRLYIQGSEKMSAEALNEIAQILKKFLEIKIATKRDDPNVDDAISAANNALQNLLDKLNKSATSLVNDSKNANSEAEMIASFMQIMSRLNNIRIQDTSEKSPDTAKSLNEALTILNKLLANLKNEEFYNAMTNNPTLNKLISKLKPVQTNLDEIEHNIIDTMSLFGPPFTNRAKKEIEILKIDKNDPTKARNIYANYENDLDNIREQMKQKADDDKHLLLKMADFITLLQSIDKAQSMKVLNELNEEMKGNDIDLTFNLKQVQRGGATDAEEVKTPVNNAEKILEEIEELRITFNKVNNYITNEIQSKYSNYNTQVFNKVFADEAQKSNYWKHTDATESKGPEDTKAVVGIYKTIADDTNDKNKWVENILKPKVTENIKELSRIREML
jgi:hypothetical protein